MKDFLICTLIGALLALGVIVAAGFIMAVRFVSAGPHHGRTAA